MKSPHTKNTLLQAATSQPTKQSLQESIFSPIQEKLKNKIIASLQKNKTSLPHKPRQTNTLTGYDIMQIDGLTVQGRRRASANSSLAKWRVTCFYDSLVLNQSAVLRLNICAKMPPLRQAANRYLQA